jgi:hypothetical protein
VASLSPAKPSLFFKNSKKIWKKIWKFYLEIFSEIFSGFFWILFWNLFSKNAAQAVVK